VNRSRVLTALVLVAFVGILVVYNVDLPVFERLRTVLALWAMGTR
jgi:hypothetical protein